MKGRAIVVWIEQSIVKIADLEYELRNLRLGYAIHEKRDQGALAKLHSLATEAADAAMRSARAAASSVVAARHVLRVAEQEISRSFEGAAEAAELAAEAAAEAARETARSVALVLGTAAMAMAQRSDLNTIQASITASSAAMRSAEAAAEVSWLAQQATLALKTQ